MSTSVPITMPRRRIRLTRAGFGRNWLHWLAFGIVGAITLAAVCAPWLTSYDPVAPDLLHRSLPPFWLDGADPAHPLGTDRQGRDVLTRTLYGARVSLFVSITAVLLSAVLGVVVGVVAGSGNRVADAIATTVVDASLSFPTILLALVLAAAVGPSLPVVIALIVAMSWGRYARLTRTQTASLMSRDFVMLAKVAGAGRWHIVRRHVLPNLINSVVVLSTLQMSWAIITEGILSFLGAGVPPPAAAWGSMLAEGRATVMTSWWITAVPAAALALVVLGFNLIGEWAEDRLDSKAL
ncbi:ABC transporter permease [Nocardia sp. BMG51109]|uniref:ABC transporter permease n=1 Tax=Nocardia sp. BMG51109 TaxID=1056816 RepID=UPI000464B09E|nr:ABC transporter permease [Nocardia sp. BMG51109]